MEDFCVRRQGSQPLFCPFSWLLKLSSLPLAMEKAPTPDYIMSPKSLTSEQASQWVDSRVPIPQCPLQARRGVDGTCPPLDWLGCLRGVGGSLQGNEFLA
jgi:hypothetical protein